RCMKYSIPKLISGPLAFLIILLLPDLDPSNVMVSRMAAVTAWVAIWWLTDAVDLPITALLPFILLPILGIADAKITSAQYMDQNLFLFMADFFLHSALNGGTSIVALPLTSLYVLEK